MEAATTTAATPPVGGITTGDVTKPNVGIDWLNVTFPGQSRDRVLGLLVKLGSHKEGPGMHWYRAGGFRWEDGAALCWNERGECWLSLNGQSLSRLGDSEAHRLLIRDLFTLGVRCTRLDLKADLPKSLLDLDNVGAAAAAGQVMGFRRYHCDKPVRDMSTGELEGHAHYFGRRGQNGGGKYVRFYDKTLESRGQIDANRYEVETGMGMAVEVFQALADCDDLDAFKRQISFRLGRFIDFRECNENDQDRHRDRRDRLAWWAAILEALGGEIETRVQRVRPKLMETVAYVERAFVRTYARLYGAAERLGWEGFSTVTAKLALLAEKGKRHWEQYQDLGGPPPTEADLVAMFA